MHLIQKNILQKLTLKPALRFSELKPQGIESNKFMYHLHALTKDGFIKKAGILYKLAPAGRRYVDKISMETFTERIQPKIVTLISCANKKGEYLVYRRKKQPFFDKIGFPYGKIHLGERVEEAARREFKEKTGLVVTLKHRGDVYLTVHDEEDLITQMLCHVFEGSSPKGELIANPSAGEIFWQNPKAIPFSDQIPGFREIIKLLKKKKSFFFDEYFLDVHEV